jgi:hypothetical protein
VKLDPGAHVFYAFGFALKSGCDMLHSRMPKEDDGNQVDAVNEPNHYSLLHVRMAMPHALSCVVRSNKRTQHAAGL